MAPPTERRLTQRELNRALLARQMLIERAPLPIVDALDRMAGLQAQYAPAMYVGLWSRVEGLLRDDVTEALQRRTAVQGTLLRATIHLVSAGDYWPIAIAIRQVRRDWYLRAFHDAPSVAEMVDAAARLRSALAGGPLRQPDIDELLGAKIRAGVGLWLDLVRVPPSGTWERRRADLYAVAEDWLGPPAGDPDDPEPGIELLVRRYLGGFGPAAAKDIANWAGLPVRAIGPAVDRMSLRRFESESGGELLDLPDGELPDFRTPVPVRFLSTWDAALLVHARRSGILPEEFRARIFNTKNPHSCPTFLVNGVVAGTWRYEDGHVRVEEFVALKRADRREVDREAERLSAFHG